MNEFQEEERKERLGPGGLDPVEVFETLPEVKPYIFFSICETSNWILFQNTQEK